MSVPIAVAAFVFCGTVAFVWWDLRRLNRKLRAGGRPGLISRRGQDELRRVYDDLHEQARASREGRA